MSRAYKRERLTSLELFKLFLLPILFKMFKMLPIVSNSMALAGAAAMLNNWVTLARPAVKEEVHQQFGRIFKWE